MQVDISAATHTEALLSPWQFDRFVARIQNESEEFSPMRFATLNRVLAITISLSFALPMQADDDLPKLRQELREVEMQVAMLMRNFPSSLTLDDQRKWIEDTARPAEVEVKITSIPGTERLMLANGRQSPLVLMRVEVSGRDQYGDVAIFLSRLARGPQPIDLEALHLKAGDDDTVRFKMRLAMPHNAGVEEQAPSLPIRDQATALRFRITEMKFLRILLAEIVQRRNVAPIPDALALFTKASESHAIALSEVTFENDLTLEGVVIGASARSALTAALESAELETTTLQMPDRGVCRKFTAKAKLPKGVAHDEAFVVNNGIFDPQPSGCIQTAKASSAPITIRGKDASGITLKLRNIDLAHVFYPLHAVPEASFVVDSDVEGVVSLDIENATLDQLLVALKSSGVAIGPPPLRRVSRATKVIPPITETFTGEPVSLSFQGADLRAVLCIFSQISGLEVHAAAGLDRTSTIFARDTEWDRAFAGLLSAHDLGYVLRENRILVGPRQLKLESSALVNVCESTSSSGRDPLAVLTLERLDPSDLELVGMTRVGGVWKAYVYLPSRRLHVVAPGQQLFEATVQSVSEKGVTITTASEGKQLIAFDK